MSFRNLKAWAAVPAVLWWSGVSSAALYAQTFEKSKMYDEVPGAERAAEKRARGRRIVDEVLARHSNGDTVVLFTHGGILQWIFAALMDSERVWSLGARNTALFDFAIDSEQWRNGDGRDDTSLWRIERFNDSDHLRV